MLLGENPNSKDKLNDCITLVGLCGKRYYKLILLAIIISVNIQFNVIYNLSKELLRLRDGWRNAFYPPPLQMIDPNEFFCPDRPDIGPIDAVYTWVNGSDPEFIKSVLQNRLSNEDQVAAKETQSNRFYGELISLKCRSPNYGPHVAEIS